MPNLNYRAKLNIASSHDRAIFIKNVYVNFSLPVCVKMFLHKYCKYLVLVIYYRTRDKAIADDDNNNDAEAVGDSDREPITESLR